LTPINTISRHNLAIIADDLTGACDVGVQFAKQGFPTSVLLGCRAAQDLRTGARNLLVLDTETRNESAGTATRRVRNLSLLCKKAGVDVTYKKIDSTVRGNLGAELDGLLSVFRRITVVVSPAYPEYRRTVVNGLLLVGGEPVNRTEFANDPLSPVRLSSIKDLIRLQTSRSVDCIYLPTVRKGPSSIAAAIRRSSKTGTRILCADAENRTDLRNIANACNLTDAMPCGSAGLAEELAAVMRAPRPGIMVLSASTNSATMSELRALVRSSTPLVKARAEALTRKKTRKSEICRVRNQVRKIIRSHRSTLVCSALYQSDLRRALLGPGNLTLHDPIASGLAAAVSPLILNGDVRAVLVTGGEMASAFLTKIDAKELNVEAEILPGIAVCNVASGRARGLKVVTKAGGFGSPGSMIRLVRYLHSASEMRV
jgi:uncharacterized protein YgbK (DUF1537 family)